MLRYYHGSQNKENMKFMYEAIRWGLKHMCEYDMPGFNCDECKYNQACRDLQNIQKHIVLDLLPKR